MKNRNGEKIGWIGGWLGGFLWLLILGAVLLFQGQWEKGTVGVALFALAVFFVFAFAPWRRPDTPYRKLMAPVYFLFFFAAGWAIWAFGGPRAVGLDWWSFFWLLPVLMPLGTAGRRTWNDAASRRRD